MGAGIPTRRLGRPTFAAFCLRLSTSTTTSPFGRRSFSCALRRKADTPSKTNPKTSSAKDAYEDFPKDLSDDPLSNPILETYLRKHKAGDKSPQPPTITGDISSTSIFKPEYENPRWDDSLTSEQLENLKHEELARKKEEKAKMEEDLRAVLLDPAPELRLRLERKLVVRDVEKHGRITKAVKLARTEREFRFKSQQLPTSTKKLTRLMHLIAGKTIEEALVQLRFSKKRIAIDVRKGLQIARDQAMLERGMGLGGHATTQAALETQETDGAANSKLYFADGTRRVAPKGEGMLIQLKDGSRKRIHDETEMYIDQAWVGPGVSRHGLDHRARGTIHQTTERTSFFSVLLKEEKTRIRLSEEMKKKRDNRKLWVALPDRPVTTQRQYNLW